MLGVLAKHWWWLLVQGIAAVLFGILTFVMPGATLITIIYFFGAYALVDGIFQLGAAIGGQTSFTGGRGWLIFAGIVSIILGIMVFAWPAATAIVVLYFIAAQAIISGIFELAAGISLRKEIEGEWMMILGGIASIIFGILLIIWPGAGVLTLLWLVGAYALVFGVIWIVLSFRLRNLKDQTLLPGF